MPAKPLNKRLNPSRQNGGTNNVLTSGPDLSKLSSESLQRLSRGAVNSIKNDGLLITGSPLGLQVDVGKEILRRSRKNLGR